MGYAVSNRLTIKLEKVVPILLFLKCCGELSICISVMRLFLLYMRGANINRKLVPILMGHHKCDMSTIILFQSHSMINYFPKNMVFWYLLHCQVAKAQRVKANLAQSR